MLGLDSVLKILTPFLGSIANTIGGVYVITQKVREFSLWTQITFTSLPQFQNLKGQCLWFAIASWMSSQADPIAKNIYGVGSAYNRATLQYT